MPNVLSSRSEEPVTEPAAPPLSGRVEGFDGLRGVAAFLVVAHHLFADFFYVRDGWFTRAPDWSPAGFLGVDVFLVLSGFLVATLAFGAQSAGVRWRSDFYRRRGLRLLPALLVLCIVHAVYSRLVGWSGSVEVKTWALAFTGTTNMASTFSHFSVATGLVPLWTLALEWQFYLLFPLVLVIVPKGRRHVGAIVFGAATVAVMIWRAHLFENGTPVIELFTRTDSRADAIFAGVTLAFAWPTIQRLPRWVHGAMGWFGLMGFTWVYLQTNYDDAFLYRGGYTLVAVLVAALLPSLLVATGPAAIFRFRPLRYLGTISYGLYIWHSFVFVAVRRAGTDWPLAVQAGVAVTLSLAVAQLSWIVIEKPVSRYLRPRQMEPLTPDAAP